MSNKIFKLPYNNDRIFGLDLLRAVAILTVVVSHGRKLLPNELHYLNDLFSIDGVSIFFVLSGFLIGGILIKILKDGKSQNNSLLNFWIRRWFRTLPNYFLVLIILLVVQSYNSNLNVESPWEYFIFSQNLVSPHPPFFSEAWSLSVEEWFYLIIPSLLFFLIKVVKIDSKKAVLITSFAIIILVVSYRYQKLLYMDFQSLEQWDLAIRKQVFTRLDSLMIGILAAYLHIYQSVLWSKYKKVLLWTGLGLFGIIKIMTTFVENYTGSLIFLEVELTLTSVATLFLLPYLSELRMKDCKTKSIITYISLISYSMYLFHFSIVRYWLLGKINWSALSGNIHLITILKYSGYWFLTLLISFFVYKYYEIPTTNLRDSLKFRKDIKNSKTKAL